MGVAYIGIADVHPVFSRPGVGDLKQAETYLSQANWALVKVHPSDPLIDHFSFFCGLLPLSQEMQAHPLTRAESRQQPRSAVSAVPGAGPPLPRPWQRHHGPQAPC